jgi:hypothetical protein
LALAGFFLLQGPLCAYACLSADSVALEEVAPQPLAETGAHHQAGCHGTSVPSPGGSDSPAGDRECSCHLLEGAPPSTQPVSAPLLSVLPALETSRIASLSCLPAARPTHELQKLPPTDILLLESILQL